MKSYIKAIIIFNKNGEKRVVPLEQGVNIITGESKTGKSALVLLIMIPLLKAMNIESTNPPDKNVKSRLS